MTATFAEFCCSDLRASLSGKDVPEDIKQRMLALHEENVSLKEQYKTAQDKLVKAKAVGFFFHCARPIAHQMGLLCSSSSSRTSCSKKSTRRASVEFHRYVRL